MPTRDLHDQLAVLPFHDFEEIGVQRGRRNAVQPDAEFIFLELLFHAGNRAVEDLAALVHQDNVIADLFHLFHAVGAEDDQPRLMQDRGDKLQLLPNPLAEVLYFLVPPALHFESGKPFPDLSRRFASAHAFKLRQIDSLFADLHPFVKPAFLRHITDVNAVLERSEGPLLEKDTPGIWVENAGDHPDQRSLTGAVRSQQTEDGTLAKRETHLVYRRLRRKGLSNLLYFQNIHE